MDAEQGFLRERSANVTAGVQNSVKPTANAVPHRTLRTLRTRIAREPSSAVRQPEHPASTSSTSLHLPCATLSETFKRVRDTRKETDDSFPWVPVPR